MILKITDYCVETGLHENKGESRETIKNYCHDPVWDNGSWEQDYQ